MSNKTRLQTNNINLQDLIDKANNLPDAGSGSGSGEEKSKFAQRVDRTLTEVTANDLKGITEINEYAFYGCSNLENITIPNTVTIINTSAFEYCSALKNIVIPNSVQIISGYAFRYCYWLTSIEIPDSVTNMPTGYEFSNCLRLTSIKIGKGVQTLKSTFSSCKALESAEIPDNVTSAASLFYMCSSLKSVTIGKGLTTLSNSIFYNCGFTDFVIPDHVVKLDRSAFSDCNQMLNMTIPSSVTNIEAYALNMGLSKNQVTFTFLGTTPPTITTSTFKTNYINKIIVPKGSLDAYKTATNWSNFADYIEEATE